MTSSILFKVTWLAVICLVFGIPLANTDISCGQVLSTLYPCLGYLRNPGASVPAPCCNGIRSVNDEAKNTPDRQSVCRCLESTIILPGINLNALANLPANCGVDLPYKISPSIDCNKYVSLNQLSFNFIYFFLINLILLRFKSLFSFLRD